ncbi:MAG: cyclic nucleotide-binding domain-containing protein [Gammaproteobacteria bacterium]|nr:cyclic nucleotide-binding domain-containing protein [Gammaproteobacteria bacterium]
MQIAFFKDSDRAAVFPQGTTIFREGEPSLGLMYIVVSGEVDIVIDGKQVDTVTAGNPLGEMGLVDKGPRSATAVARSDCRLEPIDERRFEFMVAQTPYFALEMLRVLVERLRRERAH